MALQGCLPSLPHGSAYPIKSAVDVARGGLSERTGFGVHARETQPCRQQIVEQRLAGDRLPGRVLAVAPGADHAWQVRHERLALLVAPLVVEPDHIPGQYA